MMQRLQTNSIPPDIAHALARLREQLRRLLWSEAVAVIVAALALGCWLSLATDWFFEPSSQARAVFGAAILVVLTGLAWWLARRAMVPWSNRALATLLERRFPAIEDSLLTVVAPVDEPPTDFRTRLSDETAALAARRLANIRSDQVLNREGLRRAAVFASLMLMSLVALTVASPESIAVWLRRQWALSEEPWPRRTRLTVEGFEGGVRKIARGADLPLVAKADLRGELPEWVEVRYRARQSGRGKANMTRQGNARLPQEEFQTYTHTFERVLGPISLDVVGGDARCRGLRVEVVESPALVSLELLCEFPDYLKRPSRRLSATGTSTIPMGTVLVVEGCANKPLRRIDVRRAANSAGARDESIWSASKGGPPQSTFRWPLGALDETVSLAFRLLDDDGIENLQPQTLVLVAQRDTAPTMRIRLAGTSAAVTTQARLRAEGTLTDDHGLGRIWWEHAVDSGAPSSAAIELEEAGGLEATVREEFDLRPLKLQPGQRLNIALKAADACGLSSGPNVSSSETFRLDVVTPEALYSMLASREINLRKRLESLLEEVLGQRDELANESLRVEPIGPASGETSGESGRDAAPANKATEPGGEAEPMADAADSAQSDNQISSTPPRERTKLLLAGAVQLARKNADEIQAIATGVATLLVELELNRLDTPSLSRRLGEQIAAPLREVAAKQYPPLIEMLGAMTSRVGDTDIASEQWQAAQRQLTKIIAGLEACLQEMQNLETLNEALDVLQGLMESQDKLTERTQRERNQRARALLEGSE